MPVSSRRVVVLCDRFPELSETFVVSELRALRRQGLEVSLEAVARPVTPAAVDEPVRRWEDERTVARLRAMTALALRHPLACARDLFARRRWARHEPVPPLRMLAPAARRWSAAAPVHVHVHFAAGAALAALRIARITGVPWSVTAHAWEIYQRPANLPEKLAAAAFSTSGCAYSVKELRRIAGAAHAGRIHEVVMGVDPQAFRRREPVPADRTILAVGRLVEKKGFAHLVDAVGRMRASGRPPDRVVIAGDGPLRAELQARAHGAGVGDLVELRGAVRHDEVRALLERAAVLCMPCVVAPDGDRDSMPVVVKEALAMEVPVVASDEVGLPEVVRPEWGRLVPPADPEALASALDEVLALPAGERARLGRAGRAHVERAAHVDREAARLAALIQAAG